MPTYEYECLECKNAFESFQKITDEPLKDCPKCKGKLRRLIGAGCGLIFKGTGFYITDYKRKNTSISAKNEEKSSNKDASNTEKTTTTKNK